MKKIEVIFSHGGGSLGIDKDAKLYWNEKPVATESSVDLKWWLNVSLIVGAISTFALAVIGGIDLYKKANDFDRRLNTYTSSPASHSDCLTPETAPSPSLSSPVPESSSVQVK